MLATKLKGQVTSDRKLVVKLPRNIPPGAVEVIVLSEALARPVKPRSARRKAHPAFGIWADRPEAAEAALFAAYLRQQMQNRADRRG